MNEQTDFRRLFDIFQYQQAKYPNKTALNFRAEHKWQAYATEDCIRAINEVSAGLLDLGLKKGERAAIIAGSGSPIWNFLDLSMQQIGIIVVPLHATTTRENLTYIFQEAQIKICFCATRELYDKIVDIRSETPHLQDVYMFEKTKNVPAYADLLTHPLEGHLAIFQTYRAAIHEDDLATIIYTSGTTGRPKGVMLSHKNIVTNIKAIISLVPIDYSKKTLSFLPLSHVFERMVTYTYMAVGASLYYGRGVEFLLEDFKAVRPNYFTSVPRLLEKMYDSILEQGKEKSKFSQKILHWAIRLGERYGTKRRMGLWYNFQRKIADILVYRHWRKALGGRVEGVVVGAAALRENLARMYSAAGVKIREGYGLTETSPVVAFNHFEPGMYRFGTVGIPIPGVEIKIDNPNENGEGEILVKGPNVMLGYYEKPNETRATIDQEGWLRTGDVGRLVHKRFLQITDRQKDIFKTSSGKYVAPQLVENHFKSSRLVEQCLIIGYKKPYVSALMVPNFVVLKKWCEENDVHWTAPQYMVINPKVEELFGEEVERLNAELERHERVREFHLLHEEWTIQSGEMTATMKLRRAAILERNEKAVAGLYNV